MLRNQEILADRHWRVGSLQGFAGRRSQHSSRRSVFGLPVLSWI